MPVTIHPAVKALTKSHVVLVGRLPVNRPASAMRLATRASVAFNPVVSSSSPPTVQNVTPPVGTVISPTQVIALQVILSALDSFRLVQLVASFPGLSILEVIYDGTKFGPQYSNPNNSFSAISNGVAFTVLRNNGWPAAPTFIPTAIDIFGSENS
jgi:hypothetical protein